MKPTNSTTVSRLLGRITLLVAFATVLALGISAQGKPAAANDDFKTLMTKLKGGDLNIDFKRMRMASVDSDDEAAGDADLPSRQATMVAFTARKFDEAVQNAEKALKTGYLDLETHLLLGAAHRELGDNKKFEFHRGIYLGLLNSIMSGADGMSAKTAYIVISVAEEYAVLRALELARGSQALRTEGSHKYDLLSATDPKTGAKRDVWFNIDQVWKGYEKVLK